MKKEISAEKEKQKLSKRVAINREKAPQGFMINDADVPVPKKARKAKKVKQPKKKYCSRCGSLIDHQSKQGRGCGKKYFKFKKSSATITVLAWLLAVLFALNVLQYLQNSWATEEMLDKIEDLEKRNDKQRDMFVKRLKGKTL